MLVFLSIRQGSVIVDFTITTETANPNLNVSQPLREAVKSGRVGRFEVDKNYFNIDPGIVCFVYFFFSFCLLLLSFQRITHCFF